MFLGSFNTSDFFPIARNYSSLARVIALQMGVEPTTREMIGVYHDGYALNDDRWLAVVSSLESISQLSQEHKITPARLQVSSRQVSSQPLQPCWTWWPIRRSPY